MARADWATGTCLTDCKAGWMGEDCDERECWAGREKIRVGEREGWPGRVGVSLTARLAGWAKTVMNVSAGQGDGMRTCISWTPLLKD